MSKHKFDIYSQLQDELTDFEEEKTIATTEESKKDRVRKAEESDSGYQFNQREVLEKIDLYTNDTFVSGQTDPEGRRKLFLNILNFRVDVATKQTDLDVKDFLFIPEDGGSVWGSYLMQREFKDWANDNDFGQMINRINEDRNKYGTAVVKDTKNGLEKICLQDLINDQEAESLDTADYVIQVHDDMDYDDLKEMPDWDLSNLNLDFGETITVYERYGKVPKAFLKRQKGADPEEIKEEDYKAGVDTMAIIAETKVNDKDRGNLLFIEKVNDRPYLETHFERVEGRWLGKGVAEKQFENQVAANMAANMRRQDLEWSSKKLFQTDDPNIGDQFLTQVKDGYIIEVDGEVGQVQTASTSLADYQQFEQRFKNNSNKKAFTFESATGESMPSGTPFRLGAILNQSVNSHFNRKREDLGLFFKNVTRDFILPTFKKEKRKSHMVTLFNGEAGIRKLVEEVAESRAEERLKEELLKGNVINPRQVKQEVQQDLLGQDEFFVEVPDGFYDNIQVKTDIVITGESDNIQSRIATLRTTFQLLQKQGDPRAQKVLDKILALSGENLSVVAGRRKSVRRQARQTQGGGGAAESLEGVQSPQESPNEQPEAAQQES